MKARASVALIGGGVIGLGTAYLLAKAGARDVVVLERGYVLSGASGRNGGGVRAQWTTPENIRLARESIRMFRKLPSELGINLWFRQGGYLFLAFDKSQADALSRAVAFQNRNGIPSQVLTKVQASRMVPELRADDVVCASFSPTDGVLFPWPLVLGYEQRCKELGVEVEPHTTVTALEASGDRVQRVVTDRGAIEVDWVVNCAGAHSRCPAFPSALPQRRYP